MAKIQQKSEKITTFGGIFFVLDKFDSILSSVGSGVGSTDHLHHRKKKARKFGRIFGTFGNNPYLCAIKTLSNFKIMV